MRSFAVAMVFCAFFALIPFYESQAEILSRRDAQIAKEALAAAERDRLPDAVKIAASAKNPYISDLIRWMILTRPKSGATFEQITAFILDNPDWPQQSILSRRAEEAITEATSIEAILRWFKVREPLSADGGMAYGRALMESGRSEEGIAVLRKTWIEESFGQSQERVFLSRFRPLLRVQDHQARLDRLLWDGDEDSALRMMALVDDDWQDLAAARLALMKDKPGIEAALARVPASLRNNAGLIFDRLKWRRQNDLDREALELLDHPASDSVRPDAWWSERAILARRFLQKGEISTAYKIAQGHAALQGQALAEGEWMAGWIALRFLNQPQNALDHFQHLYENVNFPVSRARGAYWAGRAAEALANQNLAIDWYRRGARHVTQFYGQLAAEKLEDVGHWALPPDPKPTKKEIDRFEARDLTKVTKILLELGALETARPFIIRLHDTAQTPGEKALVADLAEKAGRATLGVTVAKRADKEQITLISAGFPIPKLSYHQSPERALVLAVIRQESQFQEEVVSPVGARGLMQLMPTTAKKVAGDLKLSFAPQRLTNDPSYNVRLGSAYLSELLDDFDGSYILAIAAYNAGPSRSRKWMKDNGDPRSPDIDPIDWIEMIPFTETRNYVQRVLENVQVYRRRLGVDTPHSLERDLRR